MLNKWLLILGSLLYSYYTSAQCMYKEIPFEVVVNEADLITEGTVIGMETSWNEGLTMIYTIYTFETSSFYKGSHKKRIQVAVPGGTIGLRSIAVNPSLHFRIGDKGVLMVNESSLPLGRTVFEVKYAHQAWFPYKAEVMEAVGLFKSFDLKRDALAEAIESITGVKQIRLGRPIKPIKATPTGINTRAISSFSPSTITAGTESILTINGSGFGNIADTVFFLYASNPSLLASTLPSQIVSWSPTQIRVKVPDDAGTGPVFVSTTTTFGYSQQSATNLTVLSSQTNVLTATTAYITRHSTLTNTGKLTFTLNTNFDSNTAAKAALGRAMRTWRCNSSYNIEVSANTTAINTHADDNVNVITFKSLAGPLGVTYTYFQGCSISGTLYWHTTEVDIEFDDVLSSGTWNFGPGNPTFSQSDFESVALHEMAHALLLGHVIDESKVMHRFITNGATRRTASADEIAAANAVRARSTVNTNMCGFFPLTLTGNMTVSNVNDAGVGSLRQATVDVCDNDTIVFSLPVSSTITLSSAELTIDKDMKIHGLDMNNFVLSGNNARRIFSVNAGKTLTLQNMKLANATSTVNGGAIYNNGMVNLKNILFENNTQGVTKKAFTSGAGTTVKVEGTVNVKQ